uniref:Receptor expression-enhancing protein n=1 Tax=Helicotheca tamesis TaxID=374047 RepID=A0A7S2HJA8_9STRA|mmetsp:Transcript_18322/g.25216  ORF Transcript_18322/g.25216 Transcript_18322/m.25216 type:complete len:167 (+) Transcript_18322:162-662(+)
MTHPQLQEALDKIDAFLAKYPSLSQYEHLKELEKKTGYNRVYFFLLFSALLSAITFLLGGAKLVTDLVSFVYPAYMSFKAIDSGSPTEDTQWLTYWVVFGFFSIFEGTLTFLVEMIPFYFMIKVGFFIWLYHPKFLGAALVYSQVIKPAIVPYLDGAGTKPAKKLE